jgi:hypothetical protein
LFVIVPLERYFRFLLLRGFKAWIREEGLVLALTPHTRVMVGQVGEQSATEKQKTTKTNSKVKYKWKGKEKEKKKKPRGPRGRRRYWRQIIKTHKKRKKI